jgi:hypothetical protein
MSWSGLPAVDVVRLLNSLLKMVHMCCWFNVQPCCAQWLASVCSPYQRLCSSHWGGLDNHSASFDKRQAPHHMHMSSSWVVLLVILDRPLDPTQHQHVAHMHYCSHYSCS